MQTKELQRIAEEIKTKAMKHRENASKFYKEGNQYLGLTEAVASVVELEIALAIFGDTKKGE